ncbi:TMEM165/GDT1 family protein [Phytohabitans flavus]|uniref:TMEM165/GDT1 family protein n=1 Tax=Phytohabitans flavus TaxID=1076124 RepID=UPI0031EC40ED
MEYLLVALTAFVLILPVELPDKTFVATLVLSTRFPALPVWLGVIAAFGVQCLVAVGAGTLLSQLPQRPVALVAAALFGVGAAILLRGARRADTEEKEQEEEYAEKVTPSRSGLRAAGASFVVLFTAEWGDLSQLLTAGLVASGKPAIPVFFGSWAALAVVSGLAVLLGRWLLRRVRLSLVRYVAAGVCAVLCVITVIGAVTG